MPSGPDFTQKIKVTLANRAGQTCSNPDCRIATSGSHKDENKAINIGEAAHIKGARLGTARYDGTMNDEQRRCITNGIWLCRTCAKLVDSDEQTFTVDILNTWKECHEEWVSKGKLTPTTCKEISVKGGGIGSVIQNSGSGFAEQIIHNGPGPAEKITVNGNGIGEMITNTGTGTAKRIVTVGGHSSLESKVMVTENVKFVCALHAGLSITNCKTCGMEFRASKIICGFAGNEIPKSTATCPHCGASQEV